MKNLFTTALLSFLLFITCPSLVAGKEGLASTYLSDQSAVLKSTRTKEVDWTEEGRFLELLSYLNRQNSPLADYSWFFIRQADFWGVDWRLLPAISGIESSFGRVMISGSHNAYGWGGGHIEFANWRESIDWVNWGLRTGYYDRGLVSPRDIGPVWAPPSTHWGRSVALIMTQISPL